MPEIYQDWEPVLYAAKNLLDTNILSSYDYFLYESEIYFYHFKSKVYNQMNQEFLNLKVFPIIFLKLLCII